MSYVKIRDANKECAFHEQGIAILNCSIDNDCVIEMRGFLHFTMWPSWLNASMSFGRLTVKELKFFRSAINQYLRENKEETKLQHAVQVLCEELKTDEGYRESWKANIAMAFKDEWNNHMMEVQAKGKGYTDMHKISNDAADRFLNLLTRDIK